MFMTPEGEPDEHYDFPEYRETSDYPAYESPTGDVGYGDDHPIYED